MLDDGEDYIALSQVTDHKPELLTWLRKCFAVLRDYPLVRVHAMGLTQPYMLHQFKFTSADSGTWMIAANFGGIPYPRYGCDGKPDYSLPLPKLSVTPGRLGCSDHVDGDAGRFLNHRFLNEEVGIEPRTGTPRSRRSAQGLGCLRSGIGGEFGRDDLFRNQYSPAANGVAVRNAGAASAALLRRSPQDARRRARTLHGCEQYSVGMRVTRTTGAVGRRKAMMRIRRVPVRSLKAPSRKRAHRRADEGPQHPISASLERTGWELRRKAIESCLTTKNRPCMA